MQSPVTNNNLTVVGTVAGTLDGAGNWAPTTGGGGGGSGTNPATILTGQRAVAVAGTAVALGSGALVNGVAVTASLSNTTKVFIGPAGVTTADTGSGNGYPLAPGQSVSFGVSDLGAIFLNGTVAGQFVSYAGN